MRGFRMLVESQRLAQQNHRQRLARSLRVPDHPALTAHLGIPLSHPLQRLADGEVLLVARDLLHRAALVVEDELPRQFDQAFRTAERPEQTVLGGRLPILDRQLFDRGLGVRESARETASRVRAAVQGR